MTTEFSDKTVIITGGSEGVGAATARAFADAGANLVLVARRLERLERTASGLRNKARVHVRAMDVTDHDACIDLVDEAQRVFGRVDILVNNAGYHQRGPVEKVDSSNLGRMIDVNLKAPIVLSRLVIPLLREAGGGAIVNVASLAGRTAVPGAAAYSASKFGLRVFTYALAEELAGAGIKLAVVSPGPIDTAFIMSNLDEVADITFSQPLSTADEVARVILDLAVNTKRERSMPPSSGFLTTASWLIPGLGRWMRPALVQKGRKVKQRLKEQQKHAQTKDRTA